jgi:VanZ family protein
LTTPAGHRSSAGPLAVAYALLVVYASLYPFTGWRWPAGMEALQLFALPWPPYHARFDIVANLLGYLPLGALFYGAGVRNGWSEWRAAVGALAFAATLSFALEVTQNFLPTRVPSLIDWVVNGSGALIGVGIGAVLQGLGLLNRWELARNRWFIRRSAGALALLVLWPIGLLFPAPVPLGLGQVGHRLGELVEAALDGTPWSDAAADWLATFGAGGEPLSLAGEGAALVLGLLAPCLVAFAAARPGWRRVPLALGALVLAFVVTTFSTALNFGPDHALTWLAPVTLPALALGTLLAMLCAPISRRLAAGLGLVVLTLLIAVVAQAPPNPYYAESLQAWEQGRFIRFHGLARWVGWLWPYFAMAWLLLRVAARDQGEP